MESISLSEAFELGEQRPAEFFRDVVEPLSDSFDPARVADYERLMRAWIPESQARVVPAVPSVVETVYVLSRVTLGADIKITSMILDAMKRRFPKASVVFVGGKKSAELFAGDPRIEFLEAPYPRSGPVSSRIAFAEELRERLVGATRIVVDPDSRITQLGLIPLCEPERYFHFPSRTANWAANLSDLTRHWVRSTFRVDGEAYIAPLRVDLPEGERPRAAVSLGVGENESKRIGGDFEARLIAGLGERYGSIWVDRGAGGEEARRVTAAVEASGVASDKIRFWEGSFAGFASVIAQSDFYAGYDSAGQHAASAAGVPLVTYFAGAPSERFRERWAPMGRGKIEVVCGDSSGLSSLSVDHFGLR